MSRSPNRQKNSFILVLSSKAQNKDLTESKTPYPMSRQGDITTKAVVLSRKERGEPKREVIFA
jgi:hypothetical protein